MSPIARIVLALLIAALIGIVGAMLFPAAAWAQTPAACPAKPACDPVTTKDRTLCGAELKGITATGQWRAWWYATGVTAERTTWCSFRWAMLDKYAPSPRTTMTIVDSIKDASDVPQAIMDALTTYSVRPPAGSQDEYEFRLLLYAACQALRASPPTTWIAGQEPKPCVAPTPPAPPPPGTWRAVGGTIFRHAAGKLTGVVTGKSAAKDAPCTGLTVARAGTFVYQELTGGTAGEATRCVQP